MKWNYFFCWGFLFLIACSGGQKKHVEHETESTAPPAPPRDSFGISQVISSVNCRDNPALSYALYLPHQYKATAQLPALIFVDPHGDGSFPLNKYYPLAEKFGVVLMGSNDSKNGMQFNETTFILQSLYNEASQRIHADARQVSIAGFSGGAKATLVAATEIPPLLSIIYCSAGIPELPQQLPPALGITGLKDMNYTEVIETDKQLEKKHLQHSLIEWNGKHEWCDSATFQNAFYWMLFRAIEKKAAPVDKDLVQNFIKQNSRTNPDPLKEELRLQKMVAFLNGVSYVNGYQSGLQALRQQKVFMTALEKQGSDLEMESRMKQNYIECIDLKDLTWWHQEASRLKLATSNAMNARILGYLSLACYSYSSNAMKQQNYNAASKYLSIYYFVDQENVDRAFMQACLYARMQNKIGALQSIQEAINYGFTDKAKLMSEESFASLRTSNEFNELAQKIK